MDEVAKGGTNGKNAVGAEPGAVSSPFGKDTDWSLKEGETISVTIGVS